MDATDLKGIKVLVTRPEQQAQGLCQALEKRGATPYPFPLLEIKPPQNLDAAKEGVHQLKNYHWLIFISANAVEQLFSLMKKESITVPDGCKIAAIGRTTANKLNEFNIKKITIPTQRFDSEGLLALPELHDVTDQKILIVRGDGGREILAETLQQRGADVHHLAVYRRVKPNTNLNKIKSASVDIAIVTSNQSLQNFWNMAGKQHQKWLKNIALVVMSERNCTYAKKMGYQGDIIVAPQQNDEGLLAAVQQWQNRNRARRDPVADKNRESSTAKDRQLPSKAKAAADQLGIAKTEKAPSSSGGVRVIYIVFIIIVAATSSAGYQLWSKQQNIEHVVAQKMDEQNKKLMDQLELLKQTLSSDLNNQLKSSHEQGAARLKVLENLQKENALLWQSFRELEQQSGNDKRPWQLAEAAYLIRLANHRLLLQHDLGGAIAGLESADTILKLVADPALLPVREQLGRELTQLKMVDEIDTEGLSSQLIGLAESARQLPIKGVELVELQGIKEHVPESILRVEGDGWKSALSRVWSEVRSLVVITHNDKPIAPLIPAEQQSYLYHNIELQLETARMALLKGDQQIWVSSLSYARNWLYDYFDHEMPSVKKSIELIRQLEKVNISPKFPDISASLRALQKQRDKLIQKSSPVIPAEDEVNL